MTVIPYVAALMAALLNTVGDLLQRRSTRRTPSEEAGSYTLFLDLFRRPGWLLGLLSSIVGLCVHIVALSLGELATVQPLLVLELPLAVLGASWLFGVRLGRRDWLAVAVLAVGLAGFVFFLRPEGGHPAAVPGPTWAIGLAVLGAIVAALAVSGSRAGRDLRAGLLGAAAGIGYGTTAVLFSTAGAAASGGIGAVVTTWQSYAAIATGLVSFVLLQNSLSSGLLVATEPGLTLGNPLVAVIWGLLVFGEQARTGAWLIGAAVAAVLLIVGTVLLSRSSVLDKSHEHDTGNGHPSRCRSRRRTAQKSWLASEGAPWRPGRRSR